MNISLFGEEAGRQEKHQWAVSALHAWLPWLREGHGCVHDSPSLPLLSHPTPPIPNSSPPPPPPYSLSSHPRPVQALPPLSAASTLSHALSFTHTPSFVYLPSHAVVICLPATTPGRWGKHSTPMPAPLLHTPGDGILHMPACAHHAFYTHTQCPSLLSYLHRQAGSAHTCPPPLPGNFAYSPTTSHYLLGR